MKVFRFNGGRIGISRENVCYDVTDALGIDVKAWPPVQMVALIADFDRNIPRILADPKVSRFNISDVRLEVPIEWPNKLIAYPTNYRQQQAAENSKLADEAQGIYWHLKANSSLSGPCDPIVLPNLQGRDSHHECELGIVIGRKGRNIPRGRVFEYIFGYACLIDIVMRGAEERVMRKSYDSYCPFGPWITTADEVPNPGSLQTRLWVNGELRQNANTRGLILDIPGMIELASRVATLLPGDIIATGTPGGVGLIKPGDQVRIAIDHLGEMTVEVKASPT